MTTSGSPQQNNSSDVAASTMENTNTDDAQQFQQIIRDRRCKCYRFWKISLLRKEFVIFSPTHVVCNYTLFGDWRNNCS
jgi:hypothetical protein